MQSNRDHPDAHALTERVVVLDVQTNKNGRQLRVQPERCVDCATCAAGRGCRQNGIFRLFGRQRKELLLRAPRTPSYKKGDILVLAFSPYALVLACFCVYFLPLVALLLFALLGEALALRPLAIPLLAFSGMALVYSCIHLIRGGALWHQLLHPNILGKA